MKIFYLISIGLLSCGFSYSQNYFQQEVNYKINVKLDDIKHELFADEEIEYINNSPTELKEIYMHLWPNAYKNNETALGKQLIKSGKTKFYYAPDSDRGYIDQLNFKVNNQTVKWELDKENIDICKITLNTPLKSGEKLTITTPFHVKIPIGVFSRLGHLDQAYQITQWYPKPAVFDKNGWNPIPYLNQGEFYSEFGSYDVSITLPANYVVGATGDLVDGEKELNWLNEKVKETESKKDSSKDMSFPASSNETKTLRYKQSHVHDFAWFADKRFHVLKGEVTLPYSKKNVTTWVMFTNSEPKLWMNSIKYMNDAIYYYSLWNGDYPYNQATAVDGALTAGGGMEYPNVTVIGPTKSATVLEITIVHEVGHNWFYGILGSNERIHPWMDEGINSFDEQRYVYTKYKGVPGKSELGDLSKFKRFGLDKLDHKKVAEISYLYNASRGADQPIELPAPDYTDANYGGIVYSKTAIVFDYLKEYLGDDAFDKAMKAYFEAWKFKHPQPEDVKKIFEESTGKNLDWFFKDLIGTTKKLDYKISCSKSNQIKIKNNGQVSGPFSISGIKNGEEKSIKWYEGFMGKQKVDFPAGDYDTYRIDANEKIPEINRQNNTLKTKGLFRKMEPVKFHFLGSLENPKETEIYFLPAINWNNYDKAMLGMMFYNSLIPQKKLEYVIRPMYGFGSKNLVGSGEIAYNFFSSRSAFRNIRPSVNFEQYAFDNTPFLLKYQKVEPSLTFELNNNVNSDCKHVFTFRNTNIWSQRTDYSNVQAPEKIGFQYSIFGGNYHFENNQTLNPYSLNTGIEVGQYYSKLTFEGKYRISYKTKNKGVDLRLFAGKYFEKTEPVYFSALHYDPSMKLAYSGTSDYLFDETFLGRSDNSGIWSKQIVERDGGFKISAPGGNYLSRDWLTALNMKANLPGIIPFKLYGDLGLIKYKPANLQPTHNDLLYDFGIDVSLFKNFLDVYFPIALSDEFKRDISSTKYGERIRFELHLERLNFFKTLRNLPY